MPAWGSDVSLDEMRLLVRESKRLMPDVGVQIPPNLSDWWLPLVEEGATDLGGLSANGDHISPEHPFPSPHRMRKELKPRGYALTERLCVYPQYMDSEWLEQGVLDVVKARYWSFIPRRGSGRRESHAGAPRPRAARDRARPRGRDAGRRGAGGAVRRDPPGGDRGHAPGGRRAARRAGRRHGHLRGQPQHQRLERVRGGLRLLRLRPGPALARRLRARPGGVRAPGARGGGVRRHRDLHAVGHPPRLGARGLRGLAAAGQGDRAAAAPARVLADGDRPHGARRARWTRCSRVLREAGLGSTPGHRRRGAARRRARAHLAQQAAGRRAGSR